MRHVVCRINPALGISRDACISNRIFYPLILGTPPRGIFYKDRLEQEITLPNSYSKGLVPLGDAPRDRASERSSERPTERSSDRATERPIERSSDRAIERSSDRAAERPTERPRTERPSDRATERPSDRATERPSDRVDSQTLDRKTFRSPTIRFPRDPSNLLFRVLCRQGEIFDFVGSNFGILKSF